MASIIWNNLKGLKDKTEAFFGGAFCFALDWKFWRYHETQKDAIKALLNFAEKLNLNLLFIINLWTCFLGNYFMMMVFMIFPEFRDRLISIIMNYEILTLELIRGQIWPLWYIFSRLTYFWLVFIFWSMDTFYGRVFIFNQKAFGLISLENFSLTDSNRIIRHLSNLIHHTNLTKEQLKVFILISFQNTFLKFYQKRLIENPFFVHLREIKSIFKSKLERPRKVHKTKQWMCSKPTRLLEFALTLSALSFSYFNQN